MNGYYLLLTLLSNVDGEVTPTVYLRNTILSIMYNTPLSAYKLINTVIIEYSNAIELPWDTWNDDWAAGLGISGAPG